MPVVVGREVQILVSVGLLSLYCRLHTLPYSFLVSFVSRNYMLLFSYSSHVTDWSNHVTDWSYHVTDWSNHVTAQLTHSIEYSNQPVGDMPCFLCLTFTCVDILF